MKSINIIAILGVALSAPALADPLPLPEANSGLVTVANGQSVRLNVVNVDNIPTRSCSFVMSIVDANGAPLPAPNDITNLVAGTSASLWVSAPDADPLAPLQVRAHIDFSSQLVANAGKEDPMNGCYKLIPTFEVIDSTGNRVLNTTFYGMPSWKKGEKIEKVRVCHKPGTPAEKDLVIPTTALSGHIGHGDTVGECEDD